MKKISFEEYARFVTGKKLAVRSGYTEEYISSLRNGEVTGKAKIIFNLLAAVDGFRIDYESENIESG